MPEFIFDREAEKQNQAAEREFATPLRKMPAFDLGRLTFRLRRSVLLTLLSLQIKGKERATC
jgi:hypothetical protein